MKQVEPLRIEARDLLKHQADAYWHNLIDNTALDVADTYTGHEKLFSLDTLSLLRETRKVSKADDERALHSFELFVAGEIIAKESAPALEELTSARSNAKLGSHDAQHFGKSLANEASADERARAFKATQVAVAPLAPPAIRWSADVLTASRKAGFASSVAYAAELRDTTPDALLDLTNLFLAATDGIYARNLDRTALEELAIPATKVRPSDIPRLFRVAPDKSEPLAVRMISTALGLFKALGIDPEKQPGLLIDDKHGRVACIAVDVPRDVRLAMSPRAGVGPLREAVRSVVDAEMDTHCRRPEWEFQQLGAVIPRAAFQILFENLLGTDVTSKETLHRLFALRHSAGIIQYELLMESPTRNESGADIYKRVMSRALGISIEADAAQGALESDPLLESSNSLLGQILATLVGDHLTHKYGTDWKNSPLAGRDVAELWADGRHLTTAAVLRWSGAMALDPQPLADLIASRLTVK